MLNKIYEPKVSTDRENKKLERERESDRQPIFGYGDCFVANSLMLVYFVFNFVAFNIDMKIYVKCKRFYQIQIRAIQTLNRRNG